MKIVRLTAENIKRISAVHITPDGSVVVIGGKNGAGKSSVLDAIAMALGGKELVPPKPIRQGQDKAKVTVDLGDIIVTRTFTANGGGSLIVENKDDGARYPSPQAMLDRLIGRLSFDPLAFERMDEKPQAETLRQLVGLDTSDLDTQAKALYDERTGVNRSVKDLEAQLKGLPAYPEAPAEEVSIAALTLELEEQATKQRAADNAATAARLALDSAHSAEETVKLLTGRIQELERQLAAATAERARAEGQFQRLHQEALEKGRLKVAAEQAVPPAEPIRRRLADAETVNRQVRAHKAHQDTATRLEETKRRAAAMTDQITALATEKGQRLAAVTFPVPGLGLDDTGVTFNGLPFVQASQSERLRVSLAIGLALNPKLRVLLVREGSALDSAGMRLLAEHAEAHGAQIWVERVAESKDGVSVLIEDGAVAAEQVGVEA